LSIITLAASLHSAAAVQTLSPENWRTSAEDEHGGEISWSEDSQQLSLRAPESGKNRCYVQFFNSEKLEQGNYYGVSFRMRVADVSDEGVGQGGITLTLGGRSEENPWKLERGQIERQTVAVTANEWEVFKVAFQASRDYEVGQFQIDLRQSYFREQLLFHELRLRHLGDTEPTDFISEGKSYAGQEPDAAWRAAADARIREHRMADLKVNVVDEWGEPIKGASVSVKMQEHAYLFGTCVKAARITDAEIVARDPDFDYDTYFKDNVIYREKLKELFNYVVFENDMKWPMWAGRRTDRGWGQDVTLDAVKWLQAHDFSIKSHTMMWGSWRQSPKYLEERKDDPEALRGAIHRHIEDQAAAFAGKVEYADVINEAMSHNDLIEVVGWDDVAEWFRIAREGMPGTKLVINEFDILGNGGSAKRQDQHEAFIQDLLDSGAPIDLLGFQSHFWSTRLTPPERMYEIIERFGRFGLPMMISEFDMNILDEALQADYSRDFLKLWFSHPQTEAFIMWGFWAKAHWFGEPGAMFRADWTPKPNLKSYTDLVFGEWWTDATLVTDAQGETEIRAFKGDYDIVIEKEGYHASFRRPSLTEETAIQVVLYPEE